MKQSIFQSQGFKGMSLLGDQLCLSMQEFSLQHCPLPTSHSFDLEFPTILNITTVLFLLFLKHLSLPSGSTSGCCQINVSLPGVVSVPFLCDFTCENDLQKGIYFALQFQLSLYPISLTPVFCQIFQLVIKPVLSACPPDQVTLIPASAPNFTSLPSIPTQDATKHRTAKTGSLRPHPLLHAIVIQFCSSHVCKVGCHFHPILSLLFALPPLQFRPRPQPSLNSWPSELKILSSISSLLMRVKTPQHSRSFTILQSSLPTLSLSSPLYSISLA